MKDALWYARNDIRVEDVPDPSAPGPDEMIIKVGACGICGTDLEEYRAGPLFIAADKPNELTGRMAPIILGHEFAGEVVEVGRGVTRFKVGDRIAPDVMISCGECFWCQRHEVSLCDKMAALGFSGDGGLAEYCKVPVGMCMPVARDLPFDHAAMAEPISVAVRALRKSRLRLGETVTIFGGGTIGLFCMQVARSIGASAVFIVEPHAGRRALALKLGADGAFDPRSTDVPVTIRQLTRIGSDVVVEASGTTAAAPIAIDTARKSGRIVMVGLPVAAATVNFFSVVSTEKEIIGSLSHVYDEDYAAAVQLLNQGRINVEPLITERIPLHDLLDRGLHRLEREPTETLKIIVKP